MIRRVAGDPMTRSRRSASPSGEMRAPLAIPETAWLAVLRRIERRRNLLPCEARILPAARTSPRLEQNGAGASPVSLP